MKKSTGRKGRNQPTGSPLPPPGPPADEFALHEYGYGHDHGHADEHAPAHDEAAHVEGAEGEDAHAPDDALGLYLRQMGAIPLLSRDQELALAKRLEFRRRRYRHAALANWRTLGAVVDTFERVQAGQLALDPTIDVVTTLGLSRENILKRMPFNIKTLRHLLGAAEADFRGLLRAGTAAAR